MLGDQGKIREGNFRIFIFALFIVAAGLRILLFLSNPPTNAFDDHLTPIYMIMQSGALPDKDACWQCYQPPVFYYLSAVAGKIALKIGADEARLPKILQSLCCLCGILHLWLIYLILKKIPLSRFSLAIAFATACFLPQHIYISAMHSNDTISYLFVAVCVYLFLIALERKLFILWLIPLSMAIAVAEFTKYTAFVIIPTITTAYLIILSRRVVLPAKKTILAMAVTLALPLLLLSIYVSYNKENYGMFLPSNGALFKPAIHQPRAKVSFVNFKPWKIMERQIIYPDTLDSFWTLLYGKMWFDVEPKFIYFTDGNNDPWWGHYDAWLRGKGPFPDKEKKFSFFTRFTGKGLIFLGMIPLIILLAGGSRIVFGRWSLWSKTSGMDIVKMQTFPWLLIYSLAGAIALALKSPVYGSIKAVYILNSLPALTVLLGSGAMMFDGHRAIKKIVGVLFAVLFTLVVLHILYIVFGFLFVT